MKLGLVNDYYHQKSVRTVSGALYILFCDLTRMVQYVGRPIFFELKNFHDLYSDPLEEISVHTSQTKVKLKMLVMTDLKILALC